MTEKNQPKIKKVLFYTHSPRAFRTTLMSYLYDICQVYPTILLSEKLDFETEEALLDKKLFPKLEKIIPIYQYTGPHRNLLAKNRYLYKLAKDVIEKYRPDIITPLSDTHSLFGLYLFRFAKKIKALKITIQPTLEMGSKNTGPYVDLINAYLRFPAFLPLSIRLLLVKCRKYLGHFLYYWFLPIIVGEKPFFGKSSYILRKGNSGMRDADYQIVFSKRDYNIYLEDGVPAEKLYILAHPLTRNTKDFFGKIYLNKFNKAEKNKNIFCLTLLGEMGIGFKRSDFSLISKEEREKKWVEIVELISHIFPEWTIYIKPHPDTKNINKIKERFESIFNNVKVVDPQEPADKYIEIGEVIIGLPLSASTALFTASLQCPEKPILSLDLHRELLGDVYKDFNGVEYIDHEQKLIEILGLIKNNTYKKSFKQTKKQLESKEFPDTVKMLEYLFSKKRIEIVTKTRIKFFKKVEEYIRLIYIKIFPDRIYYLKKTISDCNSVLDLGCGYTSPIQYCNVPYSVGVDLHKPYIQKSKKKKSHNKYIQGDIRKINFGPNSFDAVIALEVLEHLTKEEGRRLIKKMEKWASKKVIVSTPNGYVWQNDCDKNPLQKHKCGWTVNEFKNLKFKVYGLGGLKYLRGYKSLVKYKPAFLWERITDLTQKITYYYPKMAFQLFAIKKLNINKNNFYETTK